MDCGAEKNNEKVMEIKFRYENKYNEHEEQKVEIDMDYKSTKYY